MDSVRTVNRTYFVISVLLTGAVAGAFVWLILFLMNLGITAIWDRVPVYLGEFYPLIMCVIGGIVIGFFTKRFGEYPETLPVVMGKVKKNGGYEYDKLPIMAIAALLPLIFGASLGPEAGLVGVIAGICTWVGSRMKRFGSDFKGLTELGVYAAMSAIFTAPLYGFARSVNGVRTEESGELQISKKLKMLLNIIAIAGAFAAFMLLTEYIGGGMAMPHYDKLGYGTDEFLWLIPLGLVGAIAGWMFCVLDISFHKVGEKFNGMPVLKAVIGGLVLGICGIVLPYTMFSGEVQTEELNEIWMTMTVAVLIGTGFVKIALTAFSVNMGWRGGHFFPIIFSGISIGYGMAMALNIDPIFCVCAVTAATVGATMRKPVMAVLLLLLCFPLQGIPVLIVAVLIGSFLPLPKWVKKEVNAVEGNGKETTVSE